jgi:hypothetical protein
MSMKITIENTSQVVMVNDVPARVWEGTTESGIKVQCLVTRIAVHNSQDCSQFEDELVEQPAPQPEHMEAFPLRLIL